MSDILATILYIFFCSCLGGYDISCAIKHFKEGRNFFGGALALLALYFATTIVMLALRV